MTSDVGILLSEARADARVDALASQLEFLTQHVQAVTALEAAYDTAVSELRDHRRRLAG